MSASPPPAEPAAPQSPAGAPSPGAPESAPAPANMFGSDDDNNVATTNNNTAPGSEGPEGGNEAGEAGEAAEAGEPGEAGEGAGEGDGSYVPATESSAARIPSFKKRRGSGDDEGEDEEERQRRKKKKRDAKAERRARAAAEEEDEGEEEPQLDEATRRRIALEERIDAVGKTNRAPRRKKKTGGDDIDIVDNYHDDVCVRLRDRMYTAAEADQKANMKKLPATSKLAMLDEVVNALQNTTLWSSIIDNEVLKAAKMWLEPLPDKSLPAVGIQKAIFEVLPKMDLDTATIREAGLGPIVLFYTKTKRVTPSINRAADALVQTWSRPIIKRPADFRSRYIQTVDEMERNEYNEENEYGDDEPRESSRPKKTKAKVQRFNVNEALSENRDRKGARLPSVRDVQYTVAPESRLTHRSGETGYIARIQQDNKKFNRFARQLKGQKSGR